LKEMNRRKVILIVRDGWGYTEEKRGNAVYHARTPNDDRLMEECPWTLLRCTGNAVGLPEGTQGGSEPGHLTMGAGRVVWQPFMVINRSIEDGSFYMNEALLGAAEHCREHGGKLHLMGILSNQGIHGTTSHLYALMELCRRQGFKDVYIHCFLDGRDVPERSAKEFLAQTEEQVKEKGVGMIASIIGRYYAMDRDNNLDRTRVAYDLLTLGKGAPETDVYEALEHAYKRGAETDYYVGPTVMVDGEGGPVATVDDGDAIIFWNFRSDRARQLTYALTGHAPEGFDPQKRPRVHLVCMSVYDQDLGLPVAFPQHEVENNLGHVLSSHGLRQLRIAETEKYAHVTFFFNSQVEDPCPGEDRILIPSLKVPSYEDKPEMSAPEITGRLLQEIHRSVYDFILVNYANCDLVGHSANLQAGVKACEVVDHSVGRVVEAGLQEGYVILVTGDHGNIETMVYPDGEPNPSHGINPVPLILISDHSDLRNARLRSGLGLSSIAPTILSLLGFRNPPQMTEENVIMI